MKKAMSLTNIMTRTYETLPLQGEWLDAFSTPESTGTWFIWGASGSGKSTFALQLCTELCKHGKVLYDSLEEGCSLAFKKRLEDYIPVLDHKRFHVITDTIEELYLRLKRRNSAEFIVIDSFQYSGLSYESYVKLKEAFPNKLFIFISQADGRRPAGRAAKRVQFDADLKIWVEGFTAKSNGRYIGSNGGVFTIWERGAWEFGQNQLKDK
jgi:hypothetical protein